MAQYVGRKSISKNIPQNIPQNIPAISYKYSSKYPHNRLSENHDLMLLRKRFLVKIDVVSNEPLWHSILRADAASYLGNCFVQKKNIVMKIKPQLKEAMYFGHYRRGDLHVLVPIVSWQLCSHLPSTCCDEMTLTALQSTILYGTMYISCFHQA